MIINKFIGSLSEMYPIPNNISRWIITSFSNHHTLTLHSFLRATPLFQVKIVFSTIAATVLDCLLESYKQNILLILIHMRTYKTNQIKIITYHVFSLHEKACI